MSFAQAAAEANNLVIGTEALLDCIADYLPHFFDPPGDRVAFDKATAVSLSSVYLREAIDRPDALDEQGVAIIRAVSDSDQLRAAGVPDRYATSAHDAAFVLAQGVWMLVSAAIFPASEGFVRLVIRSKHHVAGINPHRLRSSVEQFWGDCGDPNVISTRMEDLEDVVRRLPRLIAAESAAATLWQLPATGSAAPPDAYAVPEPNHTKQTKGVGAEVKMALEFQKNPAGVIGRSAAKWGQVLGVAAGTVKGYATWKTIRAFRQSEKLARAESDGSKSNRKRR